ncbi:MAG: hypothetical protein ACOYB7_14375 [Mycobacterium sp.]
MTTPEGRTLVDTVRELAGELADQVTDARKIRLLCPRGHFITDLAVVNLGGLVLTSPLAGLDHEGFASELAEIVASARLRPPRATPGMIRQSDNRIGVYDRAEVTVLCPRKNCDARRSRSYSGSFEYYSFSADVGASAAKGHAEYWLTN